MNKSLLAAIASALLLPAAWSADPPPTPSQFTAKASESGLAEVELGKLGAQKGNAAEIRAYGQRMVTDHEKANTELSAIAMAKNLPLTPTLSPAHQKAVADLNAKSGAEFDAAFKQQMVKDHAEAVALFTAATKLGDKELAAFATKTLPTLQEHNQHAERLPGAGMR